MPPWLQFLIQWLTLIFMLIGLVGLVVPIFPGLVVMWLAALVYTIIEYLAGRMDWIGWIAFALITLLMLAGGVIDNIIITQRMRGHAIPWMLIGISYLAGIVASLFLTPLAGLVASPLGLFIAEWLRLRNAKEASDGAKTYMMAWGWSIAARSGIGGAYGGGVGSVGVGENTGAMNSQRMYHKACETCRLQQYNSRTFIH